jgi:hypothetical protein
MLKEGHVPDEDWKGVGDPIHAEAQLLALKYQFRTSNKTDPAREAPTRRLHQLRKRLEMMTTRTMIWPRERPPKQKPQKDEARR